MQIVDEGVNTVVRVIRNQVRCRRAEHHITPVMANSRVITSVVALRPCIAKRDAANRLSLRVVHEHIARVIGIVRDKVIGT